eukprot:jgi/Undpi1/3370/HiC_scaffold_15.g06743.m1
MKTSAPSLVATASSCIVLFCTIPAEAFIPSPSLAASSFASSFKLETLSRNSEPQHLPLSSTCGGETVRSLKRYCPRVPGTLRSSLDDGDVGEAGGTLEAVLSEWKKVAAATAVGLAIFTGGVLVPAGEEGVVGASLAPSLMQDEKGYISIFEKSTPGVVYISTFVSQRDAFSMNVLEVPAGTGSGFVWDDKGHIVTNFHVIRQAQSAEVRLTLGDGTQKTFQADVKGYDPDKDVAVLKIDAAPETLRPIAVGSSSPLKASQLTIGNPFGLDHSLTMGVVSGLGREVKSPSGRPITNVIQTDAAINPGNSGGPLLDSLGRIIGMNTAIYSPSGGSAGIGFAIPIDTLKTVVGTIIQKGRVSRPIIGITFLESARASTVGIQKGVLVLEVAENTSAASSGLRPTTRTQLGDIIVAIDNQDVNTEADLFKILESRKPGDFISVTAQRITAEGTETLALKIQLAEAQQPKRELAEIQPPKSTLVQP